MNPDELLDIRRIKARFRRIAYLARLDGQVLSYRSDSIRIGDCEYSATDLSGIPPQYIPKDASRPVRKVDTDSTSVKTLPTLADSDTPVAHDDMDTVPAPAQKPVPAQVPAVTATETQANVVQVPTPAQIDQQFTGRTQLRGGKICFAGETSFLSNFYLICFVFCNIKYESLEQCYHHTHAIMAKALELAQEIYKETDGIKLKKTDEAHPLSR